MDDELFVQFSSQQVIMFGVVIVLGIICICLISFALYKVLCIDNKKKDEVITLNDDISMKTRARNKQVSNFDR